MRSLHPIRFATLAVAAVTLATTPVRSQTRPETPEQVAGRYIHALGAQQWDSMAVLMHPYALHQLRVFLAPLFESPLLDTSRVELLGAHTLAEAQAMSDTAVFVAFTAHALASQTELAEVMQHSTVDVIGHVAEGADTAHIVYRMTYTNGDVAVSRLDVFSLMKMGNTWRGLLSGDLRPLAAMLRRQAHAS